MKQKIAEIGGKISPIDSKNVKMEDFSLHSRKISPYLPQNRGQFDK